MKWGSRKYVSDFLVQRNTQPGSAGDSESSFEQASHFLKGPQQGVDRGPYLVPLVGWRHHPLLGRLPPAFQVARSVKTVLPTVAPDGHCTSYASLNNSVRYLGASALTFSINAPWSFSSSFGGGVVRVATGTPTSRKNFSCPAGEQIQSIRTGLVEVL